MSTHRINFRFTGRSADEGLLDASDTENYARGARQLLVLHAHFITTGQVLGSRYLSKTARYQVFKAPSARGSFDDVWLVAIVGGTLANVLADVLKPVVKRWGAHAYEHVLKDVIETVFSRMPPPLPPEERREPYFRDHVHDRSDLRSSDFRSERLYDRSDFQSEELRAPFDSYYASDNYAIEHQWDELRSRTADILARVAYPVGRSAERLVILGKDLEIGSIDKEVVRKLALEQPEPARGRSRRRAARSSTSRLSLGFEE